MDEERAVIIMEGSELKLRSFKKLKKGGRIVMAGKSWRRRKRSIV
jgi:hypothetical protein